jgi:hypothetical protein
VQEVEKMYETLHLHWDVVWEFTKRDLPREHPTSYSVAVFDRFRDAFSIAADILIDSVPERWLEIIGWPESFPVMPYDPAKIPPKLQLLIPYLEKWVRSDDYVRWLALKIAPRQEHDALLSTCDQIGGYVLIQSIVSEMFDENDRAREDEAYVVALLMQMVDHIRIQRR